MDNNSNNFCNNNNRGFNVLQLIPKYENFTEYSIELVIKIPKVAKFNIGNRYINNILDTLEEIYMLTKINKNERDKNYEKIERIRIINKIDACFSFQRSILRVMYKQRYIDEKKFNVSMRYLKEIGMMLGGYIKFVNGKIGIDSNE